MTPNDILLYKATQSISEKLPPTADGNKQRDIQPDIMQRMTT